VLWGDRQQQDFLPGRHFALSYLSHGFGGLVLCSKKYERPMWGGMGRGSGRWNRQRRTGELIIIIDKTARAR
jgi:hypothetical protein